MLKVFLVEDECVVREGLRECIDWARYGFEFCGDAPDGELALPQIRKLRPDILITDIKMPFMDGLALSKLVCAELPETKIILISGHNDFEFAQEAIEIGVEQYLLKPVTKSSLLKTLEDVSRKIGEEREQKAYLRRFQQEGQEYEQYARRKFFEQLTSAYPYNIRKTRYPKQKFSQRSRTDHFPHPSSVVQDSGLFGLPHDIREVRLVNLHAITHPQEFGLQSRTDIHTNRG